MASSMPSSAQWMSSNTSTIGRRLAIASIPARSAEKKDSRRRSGSGSAGASSGGTSSPSRRPIRAAFCMPVVAGLVAGGEERAGVGAELVPGLVGRIGVDDPALGAQHLAERPVDDPRAVGEAAADAYVGRRGLLAQAVLVLAQHPRLAHAGLADDRHELRRALAHDTLVERSERSQLVLAPDERRLARRTGAAQRVLGDQPLRLPGRHRLRLALELERLELAVVDRRVGGAHRALADRHAPGTGGALQTGRHVHRVADHRVGLAHCARQHLARVDPHAQVEVHPRRQVLVHLRHRVLHAEPGADRALGVVLVSHRCAEDRHHVVADVLVDRAPEARHLASEAHQGPVDERLHRLRVHALRERRVAGQVGEQHRDLASLLGWLLGGPGRPRRGLVLERLPAAHAEAGLGWSRSATGRAALFEPRAARHAETRAGGVLHTAGRAAHRARVPLGPVPAA